MNPSSTIIASSGVFQIEYLIETLEKDFDELISVSKSLKKIYGARSVLTKNTIRKYFNHPESLPFIARYRNEIIALLFMSFSYFYCVDFLLRNCFCIYSSRT